MKKQSGFGHVGILVAIVVIVLAGVVGWYVWDKNKKDDAKPAVTTSAQADCADPDQPCDDTIDGSEVTGESSYVSSGKNAQFSGTITKIDLSEADSDGPFYTVKIPGHGVSYVRVSAAPSCEPTAVKLPKDLKVGDMISVAAVKGEGAHVVCEKGTYIIRKEG